MGDSLRIASVARNFDSYSLRPGVYRQLLRGRTGTESHSGHHRHRGGLPGGPGTLQRGGIAVSIIPAHSPRHGVCPFGAVPAGERAVPECLAGLRVRHGGPGLPGRAGPGALHGAALQAGPPDAATASGRGGAAALPGHLAAAPAAAGAAPQVPLQALPAAGHHPPAARPGSVALPTGPALAAGSTGLVFYGSGSVCGGRGGG
mmetsp:Transcript_22990/g.33023  ORF Transcript_22990/g.33023 Transcript_22990/m.33023 type:complete len:203 (+) Transcript_22990:434-1042(+)